MFNIKKVPKISINIKKKRRNRYNLLYIYYMKINTNFY